MNISSASLNILPHTYSGVLEYHNTGLHSGILLGGGGVLLWDICDLLRENRPSGVVCQNLATYRVGCTRNGRSHRENLRTIARSVVELF